MTLEDSYYNDIMTDKKDAFLSYSLLTLVFLSVAVVAFQIYLVFTILTSCSTIYGLTISGKVFEADSFTCANPSVESVYSKKEVIYE